jgi:prenyltransferase beta subunit
MKWCPLAALALAMLSGIDPRPAASDDHLRGQAYTAEVHHAVHRGLDWLAEEQNENGSWTCQVGYKLNEDYRKYPDAMSDHVCVTALAGMAFLGSGSVPGQGKYGQNVERALDYVLSCVRNLDGYITQNQTRMYEHAFCTMFLAEIYGMSRRQDVGEKLRGAVRLIINSQNKEGGWRYTPSSVDADLSVTVSTLQALRAARNVGISVPKVVIDSALKYVKKCAEPDGSFSYQINRDMTRSTFPLTACGVVSLNSAGEYDSIEVRKGLTYLKRTRRTLHKDAYHYMYGHYYAVQAFYVAGGEQFEDYYEDVAGELLRSQRANGCWEDDVGPTYATAMACIILQAPCEYLPIFQK